LPLGHVLAAPLAEEGVLLAARSKSVAIGGRSEHFALYVLNGIVLWTFFASGTARGSPAW